MVVFTCGHCGESVQKPKVEKHYLTKCRNRNPNLSCMDCFKDFLGNDYEAHVKCITEEERYSGKGFVAKEKKGEKKQNVWVEMLQSVLDEQKNAPKNVLRIIETISKHNNTPRKKPKFINFVKNVCGAKTNPKDIDQAWDLISVKLSELSKSTSPNSNKITNNDTSESNYSKEKNDNEDESEKETNGVTSTNHEDKDSNPTANGVELNGDAKKPSKKQRKEEKKRLKYEAELQKAAEAPTEIEEKENQPNKKDKKKKNKGDIANTCGENGDVIHESKNKIKKRKRQDTVNGVVEATENEIEPVVVENGTKEKTQKKKPKVGGNDFANESVCLHDQNVAASTEIEPKKEKFDWHAVILSVLSKKGNELPFKRLQKKVLSEYSEATGNEVDDRIAEKFIKKIKSAPKVKVDKNRVVLEE